MRRRGSVKEKAPMALARCFSFEALFLGWMAGGWKGWGGERWELVSSATHSDEWQQHRHRNPSRCVDWDKARTHPAAATAASMSVPYAQLNFSKEGFSFPPASKLAMKRRLFFLLWYTTPGISEPCTAGPDVREGRGKGL